jgi:hypothetical protein
LLLTGHGASTNFYSYANFLRAAASFPYFSASSDATTGKRDLAAFLAHISHETGGLCWITEGVWGHQPAVNIWHSMRQARHAMLSTCQCLLDINMVLFAQMHARPIRDVSSTMHMSMLAGRQHSDWQFTGGGHDWSALSQIVQCCAPAKNTDALTH